MQIKKNYSISEIFRILKKAKDKDLILYFEYMENLIDIDRRVIDKQKKRLEECYDLIDKVKEYIKNLGIKKILNEIEDFLK